MLMKSFNNAFRIRSSQKHRLLGFVDWSSMRGVTFCLAIALMADSAAVAVSAAPFDSECAVPQAASGRLFRIDPVKGDPLNDGSPAHPWRSLSDLFESKSGKLTASREMGGAPRSGQIHGGDVVELMDGEYGDVSIVGFYNAQFVTIRAAAGQHPVLDSLKINAASKWIVQGLKFRASSQPQGPKRAALIDIGRGASAAAVENVFFIDNDVATVDDTSKWSLEDWVEKPTTTYGLMSGARCATISGNHFHNLRNALSVSGPNSIVSNNLFDNVGNDAIDFSSSHIVIQCNLVRDGRHSPAEPNHPDGIQGWTVNGAINRDVLIDSNTLIHIGHETGYDMQGISLFDGEWDGLTVTNNVVVTNHWHGISLFGVSNSIVANNTIVPVLPNQRPIWIQIGPSKNKRPAANVIVRNNVSTQILVDAVNASVSHNIVSRTVSVKHTGDPDAVGTTNTNVVDPLVYLEFMRIDIDKQAFDLRPREGTRLLGSGAKARADSTGARQEPDHIGALLASSPGGLTCGRN